MVRIVVLVIGLILVGFMGLAVWFTQMWGFKGFVGAAVLFLVFLWTFVSLIKRAASLAFTLPFKEKGAVLHDASVKVHSIQPTSEPVYDEDEDYEDEDYEDEDDEDADDEDEEEDDLEPRALDWYLVDVTITPEPPTGKFTHWEPGDLVLVDLDAVSGEDEHDEVGEVRDVEVWERGRWQPDEAGKYEGQQRLKLLVCIDQGVRRARFGYYFEVFGELDLPAASYTS